MHVAEVESEVRKLRLFTDSRFKAKSEQYDRSVVELQNEATNAIKKLEEVAERVEMTMKYRLEDFTTQLDNKVTAEFVQTIGRQIK